MSGDTHSYGETRKQDEKKFKIRRSVEFSSATARCIPWRADGHSHGEAYRYKRGVRGCSRLLLFSSVHLAQPPATGASGRNWLMRITYSSYTTVKSCKQPRNSWLLSCGSCNRSANVLLLNSRARRSDEQRRAGTKNEPAGVVLPAAPRHFLLDEV